MKDKLVKVLYIIDLICLVICVFIDLIMIAGMDGNLNFVIPIFIKSLIGTIIFGFIYSKLFTILKK